MDIFCNTLLLNKIHTTYDKIILKTDTGSAKVNQQGYLGSYGWVWLYEKVPTNIVCLNNLKKIIMLSMPAHTKMHLKYIKIIKF